MRIATVVLPVPGLPVKHMWRFGRSASVRPRGAGGRRRAARRSPGCASSPARARQLAVELREHALDVGLVRATRPRDRSAAARGPPRASWPPVRSLDHPRRLGRGCIRVQPVADDAIVRVDAVQAEAGSWAGRWTMKLSAVVWRPARVVGGQLHVVDRDVPCGSRAPRGDDSPLAEVEHRHPHMSQYGLRGWGSSVCSTDIAQPCSSA